jgi:hypothetical protein
MPAQFDRQTVIVRAPQAVRTSPDIADAVAQAVRLCFGVLSIAQAVVLRTSEDPTVAARERRPLIPAVDVVDLLVGTAWGAARLSGRLATSGSRVVVPLVGLVARPPLVPRRLQPGHGARLVIERWERDRPETVRSLADWSATALPGAVDAVLSQLDVGRLAKVVLDHVDLDALVVDVVQRLDVGTLTDAVLSRVDLTSIATSAIANMDLDRVVDEALEGIDLDALLSSGLGRVDLASVVSSALDKLDLTQIVVDQVDLGRVVSAALDKLDLTQIVVDQVDLGSVVSAALQRVDLTQIVLEQVDLIGVAEYVVDGIDLPEIIRGSTGSVASEAVRVVRLQGVEGDAAVARVVDRLLHRRRDRRVDTNPEQPDALSDASEESPSGTQL